MAYALVTAFIGAVSLLAFSQIRSFKRYADEAKRSGFRYFAAPIYFNSIPWMLFQDLLLPVLRRLPNSLIEKWLPLSLWYRIWHFGYRPFAKAGEDTFVMSSSSGNVLWTCDPEFINQILARRQDFIKTIEMLQLLNIYGPTFTVSEGEEHMRYRKLAAPSFGEECHRTVWRESIVQSESMANALASSNGGHSNSLNVDTARLALHVLSKVFFDKEMQWIDTDRKPPLGHRLTYREAIAGAFKYADVLFMVPRPLLNVSLKDSHQKARVAYHEFKMYMREMKEETETRLIEKSVSEKAKGGEIQVNSLLENFVKAGMLNFNRSDDLLPADAVYGNMFNFILAGHETSGNTLANAIVLLACDPQFQEALQDDIDKIFDLPHDNFSAKADITDLMQKNFEATFQKLWHGHVGALMQEVLRLWAPVPFIPKINETSQTIALSSGKQYVIAPKTLVLINTAALHRNPKYWPPTSASSKKDMQKDGSDQSPAEELLSSSTSFSQFHPERWLDNHPSKSKHEPIKGAYIPFSDGFRACFGARFARVEFCASVARIFAEYTVELADNSITGRKAAEKCMSDGMVFGLGLRMGQHVKLRFVKREQAS